MLHSFATVLCVLFLFLSVPHTALAAKNFPLYYAIVDNVTFWEKIYSTYSLNQAVIHDSEDLSKIYAVIPLHKRSRKGADRLNTKKQKQARKKYKTILKRLSTTPPKTPEEKRVAAMFTGKTPRRDMKKSASRVRSQTGQKERFESGVIRSGAYMTEIQKIFRAHNLPVELSYLPHVESSFNTKAYSKFGAAGVWQFTRTTGKQYLKINSIVDERLDPILASHAAAKYLKKSYQKLNHWPMAVTSYNYGLSGMMRAKKDLGTYTDIFNTYSKGHFKFASKNFYSEFLAAYRVAQRLEKNLKLAPPQTSRQIQLKGYAGANDIANYFKIKEKKLQELNPALRPPVFRGEKFIPKGYNLRLPDSKNISNRIATIPASLYQKNQKPSRYHRVKKGDTGGSIARLHGVSLRSLMQTNNLDKYATIYIRQKLKIPFSSTAGKSSNIPKLSARPKNRPSTEQGHSIPSLVAVKKKRVLKPDSSLLPAQDSTVYNVFNVKTRNGIQSGTIKVQPEESIGLYAEWLGIKDTVLLKFTGFKSKSLISPGQKIHLPFERVTPERFEEKRLDFLQETEDDFFSAYTVVGQTLYRVLAGDTLWDLCHNRFDIPLWLLERYNSTIDLARIHTKQELIIPVVQQL
jgi:membrane-bound lytic murein transglycosylase D